VEASADRAGAPYSPIADYALVGDCHGAALISREGSVDWCCLRRFDADPVFCRILDARKGGFLAVRPVEEFTVERAYLGDTNILQTIFTTGSGQVELLDFMPVGRKPGSRVHDYVSLNAPFWLVRRIQGLEGRVRLRASFRASVDFAGSPEPGPLPWTDLEFRGRDSCAVADLEIRAGETRHVIVGADPRARGDTLRETVDRLYGITRSFWEEWMDYCRYQGPYQKAVRRSALALKLLTYAPSGAIVAAPTTSLPEEIGGARNWDYRYCWIRDTSFTLYAFAALGYGGEALRFVHFLRRICFLDPARVQIMFGVDGETRLEEKILDHLEGYRGSRPVRTGNGAYRQEQLDVYGELLDWAWLHKVLGGKIDETDYHCLGGIADYVAVHWDKPDQGIWEMRGPPLRHTYGKVLAWVALDRAVRLFGPKPAWLEARASIVKAVREFGIDPRTGALKQTFERPQADAALLVVPQVGFPLEEEVLQRTVDHVAQELGHGPFFQRYRTPDGLSGGEGAFLICSFWYVDALLHLGREEEARVHFEQLLELANDVGLYSEEIDPASGAFLGNFPQAFTHLALVQSATNLELHRRLGPKGVRGSNADRARRGVEATAGIRALWAHFKKTGRVSRIFSSRDSVMEAPLERN